MKKGICKNAETQGLTVRDNGGAVVVGLGWSELGATIYTYPTGPKHATAIAQYMEIY
jgi:hypothetical protein